MAFAFPTTTASIDPVPRYTRDPETASVLSSAPSYTSAAPSYQSSAPHHSLLGFAPGFSAPARNTVNPSHGRDALHQFNSNSWTRTGQGGTHARQLNNVAHRRATRELERNEREAREAMASVRLASQMRLIAELDSVHELEEMTFRNEREVVESISRTNRTEVRERRGRADDSVSEVSTVRSESERPEMRRAETAPACSAVTSMIDTAIAVIEREQREARRATPQNRQALPRTLQPAALQRRVTVAEPEVVRQAPTPVTTAEEAMSHENKSWNFMLAQMHDWTERERSWARFKESLEGSGGRLGKGGFFGFGMGRRIGFKRRS